VQGCKKVASPGRAHREGEHGAAPVCSDDGRAGAEQRLDALAVPSPCCNEQHTAPAVV
jgi:hypothetical protein